MEKVYIIAAARKINGNGSLDSCNRILQLLERKNIESKTFFIDSLKDGWDTPVEKDHFRSGCAPIEALQHAYELISKGFDGLVIISGKDNLKTEYDRDERHQLMEIYGHGQPLPYAYDRLAKAYIRINDLRKTDFIHISKLLFENYLKTYKRNNGYVKVDDKWFQFITEHFRGVDCANPSVDFSGMVMLSNMTVAKRVGVDENMSVELAGTGIGETCDGPECIPDIANFHHLEAACRWAVETSGIDFVDSFLKKEALLETYTCYPVIPIAFLMHSGIGKRFSHIPELLSEYEITVTGGMNLSYAPWNNPALNALVVMFDLLRKFDKKIGIVHGNGGLGYKQGIAILKNSISGRI